MVVFVHKTTQNATSLYNAICFNRPRQWLLLFSLNNYHINRSMNGDINCNKTRIRQFCGASLVERCSEIVHMWSFLFRMTFCCLSTFSLLKSSKLFHILQFRSYFNNSFLLIIAFLFCIWSERNKEWRMSKLVNVVTVSVPMEMEMSHFIRQSFRVSCQQTKTNCTTL